MITPEELATRFTYHPPRTGQPETYEAIRDAAKAFATYLVALTPESREQSLAVTAIEEAVFWANAAIARRESYRPQPGPVADRDGRANWSAFWSEAKRLGFDAKAVHALAGTKSLAHLEPEAVEDLLNVMRDREGYARPAGDEKCVALTASWCGTEQRNANGRLMAASKDLYDAAVAARKPGPYTELIADLTKAIAEADFGSQE